MKRLRIMLGARGGLRDAWTIVDLGRNQDRSACVEPSTHELVECASSRTQ